MLNFLAASAESDSSNNSGEDDCGFHGILSFSFQIWPELNARPCSLAGSSAPSFIGWNPTSLTATPRVAAANASYDAPHLHAYETHVGNRTIWLPI